MRAKRNGTCTVCKLGYKANSTKVVYIGRNLAVHSNCMVRQSLPESKEVKEEQLSEEDLELLSYNPKSKSKAKPLVRRAA